MKCVPDANGAEPGYANGQESPESEQPLSWETMLKLLITAIDEQNLLLGQIVAQNADLISMLASEDEDDEPRYDLAGKPL